MTNNISILGHKWRIQERTGPRSTQEFQYMPLDVKVMGSVVGSPANSSRNGISDG